MLLVRLTHKTPASDRLLLLKGPAGEVTGGFHHGDRLDAAKAQRLLQVHEWEEWDELEPQGMSSDSKANLKGT